MLGYIRNSINIIKARNPQYPIIVILDWDAASKLESFKKLFADSDPFKVFAWDSNNANPNLTECFHGIERFMSDRIIEKAKNEGARISKYDNGTLSILNNDYSEFKNIVTNIVKRDIRYDDLVYSKPFLEQVLLSVGITI